MHSKIVVVKDGNARAAATHMIMIKTSLYYSQLSSVLGIFIFAG